MSWNYTCKITSTHHRWINTWWRHQMETFSALLALCDGNSRVTGEFPSQKPVTRSFDVSLICAWTNGWVKNRGASDLRRHRAHDDVTVMILGLANIVATEIAMVGLWSSAVSVLNLALRTNPHKYIPYSIHNITTHICICVCICMGVCICIWYLYSTAADVLNMYFFRFYVFGGF